jgi:hypothetical protein
MIPAAIGSERKRHMPTSTTTIVPPMVISDWSSVSKRKPYFFLFPCLNFCLFLETYPYPQQQQQTRDYPR